jgi:hypothetical protein
MNNSDKAHELYKKMISMNGKFTILFHNLNKYKGTTLVEGSCTWDEKTKSGTAEIITEKGKIKFDFTQVKKIYKPSFLQP